MPTRLRTLLLFLIATLFIASGVARAAPPMTGMVLPCHAMSDMPDMVPATDHRAPEPKPAHPDMMAMNCCLGCLPSPALVGPFAVRLEQPTRIAFEVRAAALEGRSLAPELGPPRAA